jgi:hypothetical protein
MKTLTLNQMMKIQEMNARKIKSLALEMQKVHDEHEKMKQKAKAYRRFQKALVNVSNHSSYAECTREWDVTFDITPHDVQVWTKQECKCICKVNIVNISVLKSRITKELIVVGSTCIANYALDCNEDNLVKCYINHIINSRNLTCSGIFMPYLYCKFNKMLPQHQLDAYVTISLRPSKYRSEKQIKYLKDIRNKMLKCWKLKTRISVHDIKLKEYLYREEYDFLLNRARNMLRR